MKPRSPGGNSPRGIGYRFPPETKHCFTSIGLALLLELSQPRVIDDNFFKGGQPEALCYRETSYWLPSLRTANLLDVDQICGAR
ncbi:MAG: hypothetical protein DRP71_16055 [Verrucomicrobia bacterium]|nr:MAG: hypothetical protein DRP71_16055 [Verrucomicrobiota bacterium]